MANESPPASSARQPSAATGSEPGGGLRKNAVSPWAVAITSMAGAGPAASVALAIPVMAAFAGRAAIFALVITLLAMAALTNTFAEFSKRIPSAGSLYAWNSAGLGPNFGFIFGWFFVGCYLCIAAEGFSVAGGYLQSFFQTAFSANIPWWIFSCVAVLYVLAFAWRGIHVSSQAALTLLAFEVGIVIALMLWLLISGDAHPSLSVFNPGTSPGGWSAIGLAISFGIVGLAGFEEAATLGEEAQDPRRSVGRGLFTAVILLQVFFIFAGWIALSSYGSVAKYAADPNGLQTLASRAWGGFGNVITVILISSVLAFTLTAFNAGVRVIYSLSRVRVIPPLFARTSPRFQTPGPAIILLAVVTIPPAFILGAFKGPISAFAYYGFLVSVAFAVIYVLTNFALLRYIRRYAPGEFSVVRHVILPLVAVLGVGYALYRSVVPLPPAPLNLLPWVIAAWAVIGIGILVYLRVSGRADIRDVGRAFAAEWDEAAQSEVRP